MIKLKEFQEKMVDKLLRFTAPDYKVNELLIKAPTGSGKTICLLSWINDYIISTHDDVVFVWFTPGAGELEEQSKDKAKGFTNIKSQSVDEALNQGFEKETVTFINYERVTGKKKKAMMTDSEKDNLEDKINEAFRKGYH
ncbi:DEAD/DEAH box helicase family protein, partial [Staphylococcus aureus]|nr:DEAD/DEAH box helicase family protein [Staphylococcus aureus]